MKMEGNVRGEWAEIQGEIVYEGGNLLEKGMPKTKKKREPERDRFFEKSITNLSVGVTSIETSRSSSHSVFL